MAAGDKPHILIVDDEPDILDFIERVLRRRYAITRCQSAEEALGRLSEEDFELLITDEKMPRVSGLDLLEEAAKRRPAMVRLLLSGYTNLAQMEKASRSGAVHHFVLKPVDSQKLLESVERAYEARDRRRA